MSDALNRRGFLGLAGGLGLAALTGCGSDGQAAAQPKQGGRLRAVYAGGGAKEVLDPHVQSLFVDIARHKAMYEKLVELGPDLKPVPRLAEKWESDAQALTWRFTLRDETFHDGNKLTGEDVLYSLARIADPKVPERVAQSSSRLSPVMPRRDRWRRCGRGRSPRWTSSRCRGRRCPGTGGTRRWPGTRSSHLRHRRISLE